MTLKNIIQQDIIKAMKLGEKDKLEVLRYLTAQIQDKEIEQGRKELNDQELISLINGQIKKLEEGIELFKKGLRQDLVKKNLQEIAILKVYLPKQISDEELEKEIMAIIKANPNLPHPGALIGIAIKKLTGRADNKRIAGMVMKNILDNKNYLNKDAAAC